MTLTRTENVKLLREKTGAALLLIREALEKCGGDPARAELYIAQHRKGAEGRRELGTGVIVADTHQGRIGARWSRCACGTDFVARTDEFRAPCAASWSSRPSADRARGRSKSRIPSATRRARWLRSSTSVPARSANRSRWPATSAGPCEN